MKRRALLAALGGVAATRCEALAQPKAKRLIGMLGEGFPEDPAIALNLAMFRRGLRQEGFVEGQNVEIIYKWAHNQTQLLPNLAAELVALPIEVLVNEGGTVTAIAAKKATSTIPIVFHASNALDDGLVDSLARPSGNLTGVSQFATETLTKGYQLLAEMAPQAKSIAFLSTGQAPTVAARAVEQIRAATGETLQSISPETDQQIEAAYAALSREGRAVIVFANASFAEKLVALASRYKVPAIYNQRAYVAAGGLISYGASIPAAYVIKGLYTGRILKGAKPGDLPVQQASKFELALNLRTAEALKIAIPQTILLAADEVIE